MIYRILPGPLLEHPGWLAFLEHIRAHWGYPAGFAAYVNSLCGRPEVLVLLGAAGDDLKALLITELPTNPLMLLPWVTLAYNAGTPQLGDAVVRVATRWLREQGWQSFRFLNNSGRSDAAYERTLRPHGRVVQCQSCLTVKLHKEEEENAEVPTRGTA